MWRGEEAAPARGPAGVAQRHTACAMKSRTQLQLSTFGVMREAAGRHGTQAMSMRTGQQGEDAGRRRAGSGASPAAARERLPHEEMSPPLPRGR